MSFGSHVGVEESKIHLLPIAEDVSMDKTKEMTVVLPAEVAALVESKVASGDYADASAVVLDGIEALAAEDAAIARWLAAEVLPAYDAVDQDPTRAIPLSEARRRIGTFMTRRTVASHGR